MVMRKVRKGLANHFSLATQLQNPRTLTHRVDVAANVAQG